MELVTLDFSSRIGTQPWNVPRLYRSLHLPEDHLPRCQWQNLHGCQWGDGLLRHCTEVDYLQRGEVYSTL